MSMIEKVLAPDIERADSALESWDKLKTIIDEMKSASPFQRDFEAGGREKLTPKAGVESRFREIGTLFIERLHGPDDPKVEGVIEFTQTFNPEESDTPDIILDALVNPKDIYAYHTLENSEGRMLSHIQSSLLELKSTDPNKKQAIIFNGFSITDDALQRRHLATEMFQTMLACSLEKAQSKQQEIQAIIVEGKANSELFWNFVGLRRLYFEDDGGNFHEIPYIQPPIDWDEDTGFPRGYKKGDSIKKFSSPEHLMVRAINSKKEISIAELLPMIESIYYDNYVSQSEGMDFSAEAKKRIPQLVEQFKLELVDNLKKSANGKLVMLSAAERQQKMEELGQRGKTLTEFFTTQEEQNQLKAEELQNAYVAESEVAGKGLFARRDFDAGEIISTYRVGKFRKYVIEEKLRPGRGDTAIQIATDKHGEPLYAVVPTDHPRAFVNHSCDPNAILHIVDKPDGTKDSLLTAIKPIKKDGEIFIDYSTTQSEEWEMPCNCGSPNCRHVITEFGRLPQKLKDKYRKLGALFLN